MDKKSKEALRRYKKSRQAQSSSESSSSSDSDSGSSSSYSSSDSERRHRHKKSRQSGAVRRSTSSSDERHKREKRDHCQKKLEAKRNHLKRKLKEAKLKKKAAAAAAALSGHSHRALSPATQAKLKKLAERKHLRAASKERREREKEKHRAALREREREHHRAGTSRSPTKITKIRIHQDVKRQKSPPRMHHQLMSREKIIIQTRTRDRTPSAERERQRHEHKIRHEDMARERERRDREAARDKERAEALARCQERQRERERLAREKLRREEEEKYGKSSVSERLLPRVPERDIPVRGYDPRERSLERAKREMDVYEHGYIRKHRGEPDYEDELERRGHLDREELLREREYLARRRELSPGEYVGPSSSRMRGDPRDLYTEEERERAYKRAYLDDVPPRGHPMNREAWLAERELREREMHEHPRDYRDIEAERMYPDERERLPPRDARERPPFVGRPGPEWKRNDWGSPRERADWQGDEGGPPTSGRGMGFVGGPKRGGGVGLTGKILPLIQQREQRPPSEPDWDAEEGQIDTPKKADGTPKRDWIEHDQREMPINRDKPGPGGRQWGPNEWREGEENAGPSSGYQRGPPGPMMHHPRGERGGRGGFRGRGGHMDHGERMPGGHGFRPHHPPALMNLPVPPPGPFHGPGPMPRFPNKRNMTYTNPNLLKKQQVALAAAKAAAQASAVAAATTAVAAAKAAAQSAANATTNPGILGQVSSNRSQMTDDKPEAGEIVGENEQKEETSSAAEEGAEQKEKKNSGELSEISDSDDDILNKTEKKAKLENEDSNSQCRTENKDTTEDKGDEDEIMDFEEISDGELEEERAAKGELFLIKFKKKKKKLLFKIVWAMHVGVDWSSLVAETKRVPSNQATTAKQKWQPHRIILDVGISMRMAGEEYAKRLLNEAKQQLDEELKVENAKQKQSRN
ncbi:hypothetical protein DOY81_010523 [Sarcophaga bullata]|nr:hypothetical protein DOY81_010523 [Sarcophaga bullata]